MTDPDNANSNDTGLRIGVGCGCGCLSFLVLACVFSGLGVALGAFLDEERIYRSDPEVWIPLSTTVSVVLALVLGGIVNVAVPLIWGAMAGKKPQPPARPNAF